MVFMMAAVRKQEDDFCAFTEGEMNSKEKTEEKETFLNICTDT